MQLVKKCFRTSTVPLKLTIHLHFTRIGNQPEINYINNENILIRNNFELLKLLLTAVPTEFFN